VLEVPAAIWRDSLSVLRACGVPNKECVVFWTGPADQPQVVDEMVHPLHQANATHYEVDEAWLHPFWVGLARSRRSVRLQLHTHVGRAFHSRSDDEGPIVHIPGFLSLVLPRLGAAADPLSDAYLAEISPGGKFIEVPIRERIGFQG
jgi:hypothetical protein